MNQRFRATLQLPGAFGRDQNKTKFAVDGNGLFVHYYYPPKLAKIGSNCVCTRSFRQLSARTRKDSSASRLPVPAFRSCLWRRSASTMAFKRSAEISN